MSDYFNADLEIVDDNNDIFNTSEFIDNLFNDYKDKFNKAITSELFKKRKECLMEYIDEEKYVYDIKELSDKFYALINTGESKNSYEDWKFPLIAWFICNSHDCSCNKGRGSSNYTIYFISLTGVAYKNGYDWKQAYFIEKERLPMTKDCYNSIIEKCSSYTYNGIENIDGCFQYFKGFSNASCMSSHFNSWFMINNKMDLEEYAKDRYIIEKGRESMKRLIEKNNILKINLDIEKETFNDEKEEFAKYKENIEKMLKEEQDRISIQNKKLITKSNLIKAKKSKLKKLKEVDNLSNIIIELKEILSDISLEDLDDDYIKRIELIENKLYKDDEKEIAVAEFIEDKQ
jgi:hypothetical protein